MNAKHLALIAALTTASVPVSAGTFFGFRVNFGGPYYAAAPVVYPPPTTVVVEPATASPGPGYLWVTGHWDWNGQHWVWQNGRWALPPQPEAAWSPGHWVRGTQGWVWAEGAWIVPTPPPLAAASGVVPPEVYVTQSPPAPLVESIPLCPGPDFIWIGGSWAWRGSWVWTSGYYFRRPAGFSAWVPGYWGHRSGGWAWSRGRWR